MSETMTTEKLYELVSKWPRGGFDSWPVDVYYEEGGDGSRPHFTIDTGSCGYCPPSIALALFRDKGTQYLIGEGYHTHEWGYNFDTEKVSLDLYGEVYEGRSDIEALTAAILGVSA